MEKIIVFDLFRQIIVFGRDAFRRVLGNDFLCFFLGFGRGFGRFDFGECILFFQSEILFRGE